MKHKRLTNVDEVKQVTVIRVTSIRGKGTDDFPSEKITEYFLPDGTRLARITRESKPLKIHEWEDETYPEMSDEEKSDLVRGAVENADYSEGKP